MRVFVEKTLCLLGCLLIIAPLISIQVHIQSILAIYTLVLTFDIFVKKECQIANLLGLAIILYLSNDGIVFIPILIYCVTQLNNKIGIISLSLLCLTFNVPLLFWGLLNYYFAYQANQYDALHKQNDSIQYSLESDKIKLHQQHLQLQHDQVKNIEIATLQERNRIAHQLHDTIGHIISSSILQLEALHIMTKEPMTQEKISNLSQLMQEGMTDIRQTLHSLYDTSFDLPLKISQIIDTLQSVNVQSNVMINHNLDISLKMDILSIIQELVANFNKHSNADIVKITVLEQPAFYTITYQDNGQLKKQKHHGIGLLSIQETTRKYHGVMTLNTDNGFHLHIILMKGGTTNDSHHTY